MKRLHARLLLPLLIAGCMSAQAEVGGYRVEVIVFQNLQANVDAVEVDKLRSFSNVPDLQVDSLPDDLEVLTDRSQRMEGVWQRLRSSKTYRPLIYTSWVQNNIDYHPPFRIHDEMIIDTQIRSPGNMVVADLQAQDPLAAYRSDFYRLDGSAQLRLSRFLHMSLNLEFRVPAALRSQTDLAMAQPAVMESDLNPVNPEPEVRLVEAITTPETDLPDYDVYRLTQSRQVKTDRLQYFDSPWFGALVLVIPIAAEPIATVPVPLGLPDNTN